MAYLLKALKGASRMGWFFMMVAEIFVLRNPGYQMTLLVFE